MAIEYKKVLKLQEAWGDKVCNHPRFEKEVYGMVTVSGYIETKTGDYVCMQCGEVFTKEEKERLEKRNIDM